MSGPVKPISTNFVNNVQVSSDSAHGPYPNHADVRTKFPDLPGVCQKLRIDHSSNILTDDLEFGTRFLNDLKK